MQLIEAVPLVLRHPMLLPPTGFARMPQVAFLVFAAVELELLLVPAGAMLAVELPMVDHLLQAVVRCR